MKLKAEMGHYSSVVGNSVHLIGEDGRFLGQIAFMCQDDRLRDKDVQTRLSRIICDAVNAVPAPAVPDDVAGLIAELRADAELHQDLLPDRAADALEGMAKRDADLRHLLIITLKLCGAIDAGLEWRFVVGYEPNYLVSENGDIFSIPRTKTRGGLVQPALNERGYPRVCLYGDTKSSEYVHHIVANAFLGPRPEGAIIRHLNGDSTFCRYTNLAYGTIAENEADKEAHGRVLRGENAPSAKLTWDAIREIRSAKGKIKQVELATQYDVARSTIQRIQAGQTWSRE